MTNPRRLLPIALVALALLAAAWLVRNARVAAAPQPALPSTMPAPATLAAHESAEERRAAFLPPAAEPASVAAEGGVTVGVRDAQRNVMLPGAEVRLFRARDGLPALAAGNDFGSLDSADPAAAELLVADERGYVHVPRLAQRALLVGRWQDLWGAVDLPEGDPDGYDLSLHRDGDLLVQVLDARGEPVSGMRVLLGVDETPSAFRYAFSLAGTTDETTGTARIAHARAWMAQSQSEVFHVTADVVLPEPIAVAIRRDADFAEPIRVQLPATGVVDVELLDGRGEPDRRETIVELAAWSGPPAAGGRHQQHVAAIAPVNVTMEERYAFLERGSAEDRAARALEQARLRSAVRVRAVDGHARFRWVGLGLALDAEAATGGPLADTLCEQGRGPHAGGETVTLRLGGPEAVSVFVGRLLAPGGTPLASTRVDTGYCCDATVNQVLEAGSLTTDSAGRFRIPQGFHRREDYPWKLSVVLDRGVSEAPLAAELELTRPPAPRVVDLGDVTLSPWPTLATGAVVDESGAPVAGALVTISLPMPGSTEPETRLSERGTARADDRGRFWLWRPKAFAKVGLQAQAPYCSAPPMVELAGGSTAVSLLLVHGGDVQISTLPEARLFSNDLRAIWIPDAADGGVERAGGERVLRLESEPWGRWMRTPSLVPGTGTLRVMYAPPLPGTGMTDGPEPDPAAVESQARWTEIAKVAGVQIVAGRTNCDPRLQGLAQPGSLDVCIVDVLGPEGRLGYRARVWARKSGSREPWTLLHPVTDAAGFRTGEGPLDLRCGSDGLRWEELDGVTSSVTVRLRPALRVRLACDGDAARLADLEGRTATLTRVHDDEERMDPSAHVFASAKFDAIGEASCALAAAGRYEIRWDQAPIEVGAAEREPFVVKQRFFLEVSGEPAEQSFRLPLDALASEVVLRAQER